MQFSHPEMYNELFNSCLETENQSIISHDPNSNRTYPKKFEASPPSLQLTTAEVYNKLPNDISSAAALPQKQLPAQISFPDFRLHQLLEIVRDMDAKDGPITKQFMTWNEFGGCTCTWKDGLCSNGDYCPFIAKYLGIRTQINTLPESDSNKIVRKVMVLRKVLDNDNQNKPEINLPGLDDTSVPSRTTQYINEIVDVTAQHKMENFDKGQMTKIEAGHGTMLDHASFQMTVAPTHAQAIYPNNVAYHELDTSYNFSGEKETARSPEVVDTISYQPPPNVMVVKVPSISNSEDVSVSLARPFVYHTQEEPYLCQDCDTSFVIKPLLAKHIRNQHAVYTCTKCYETTVGYYRMASHNKREHSKDPLYPCQCGRNFAESKGLAKHQNSCHYGLKI